MIIQARVVFAVRRCNWLPWLKQGRDMRGHLLMQKSLEWFERETGEGGEATELLWRNSERSLLLCCWICFRLRKMLILRCLFIVFTITKWLAFKLITITKGTFGPLNVPCSSPSLHVICCFVEHFVGPHPFRKQMGSDLINWGPPLTSLTHASYVHRGVGQNRGNEM